MCEFTPIKRNLADAFACHSPESSITDRDRFSFDEVDSEAFSPDESQDYYLKWRVNVATKPPGLRVYYRDSPHLHPLVRDKRVRTARGLLVDIAASFDGQLVDTVLVDWRCELLYEDYSPVITKEEPIVVQSKYYDVDKRTWTYLLQIREISSKHQKRRFRLKIFSDSFKGEEAASADSMRCVGSYLGPITVKTKRSKEDKRILPEEYNQTSDIPTTTPQIHHSTQPEDSLHRHANAGESILQDPRLLPHARGHMLENPMHRSAGLRATMLGAIQTPGNATDAFRRGFLHNLGQRLSSASTGTQNQNSAALHLLHHNSHPTTGISQNVNHADDSFSVASSHIPTTSTNSVIASPSYPSGGAANGSNRATPSTLDMNEKKRIVLQGCITPSNKTPALAAADYAAAAGDLQARPVPRASVVAGVDAVAAAANGGNCTSIVTATGGAYAVATAPATAVDALLPPTSTGIACSIFDESSESLRFRQMSRIEAQLRKNCEILHTLKNSLSQSHCAFHHATHDTAAAADVFDQHQRSLHLDFDFSASDMQQTVSVAQQFAKQTPPSVQPCAQAHDTNTNANNRLCRGPDMLSRGPKLGSSANTDGCITANTLFAPIPIVPPPGTSAHVPAAISFRNYTPSSETSAMSSSSVGSGLSQPNHTTRGFNRRGSETIAELVSRQMKGGSAGAQSTSQSSSVRTPRVAPPPHPSPPTLYSLMAMSNQHGASASSQNSGFLKSC